MRILLINVNTTEAVTERLVAVAGACRSPGIELSLVTACFGVSIIGSRVERAMAGRSNCLARSAAGHAAVIIAASMDAWLAAARELLDVPVAGITEAAPSRGLSAGRQIEAVVGGATSGAMGG